MSENATLNAQLAAAESIEDLYQAIGGNFWCVRA
jgi:hypothetical protein